MCFWGRCAQNCQKIDSKNYKNYRDGVAFYNLLILFSYNFERSDHELLYHYLLTIINIDAAGRGLAVELATVKGVPAVGSAGVLARLNAVDAGGVARAPFAVAEVEDEGADGGGEEFARGVTGSLRCCGVFCLRSFLSADFQDCPLGPWSPQP